MLRKLLSVILSLMLIISAVSGLTYAKTNEETIYGRESIGILKELKIANLNEEDLNVNIKRADFLKMISIVAGYAGMKSEQQIFADLSLDDEREPYLKALYNLNVIAPDSKGNIYPDADISIAEAAAIAVKLTGYTVVAEQKGGYPTGYMNVAKMNNLLKGIPTNAYTVLTNGMAARLIDNVLNAELMVQTGFGNESYYVEGANGTFLSMVFGVKCVENVLEGVDISRITGENDIDTFYIEIANLKIEVSDIIEENIYDYLGYGVKAYYREERADIPRLIYIEKSDKNNETVIKVDDIEKVSGYKITAYEDGSNRKKTISYKRGIPVIYNGVSTNKPFSKEMISGKNGLVRLLDNTGDKTFDIIFVDLYSNFIVSHVDTEGKKAYDKYDTAKTIALDITENEPYTIIYNSEGKEVALSKVKAGNVLSVFESADDAYQKYVRIHINDKIITGQITSKKSDGQIIVNDVAYELTDECKKNNEKLLEIRSTVKMYLDYSGKVADVERVSAGEFSYGFVAAGDPGSSGGLSNKVKLKIYTQSNAFEIYELAENVRFDGNKVKAADVIGKLETVSQSLYPGSTTCSSLIRFALNGYGEISTIDTVINGESNAKASRYDMALEEDALFYIKTENKSSTTNPSEEYCSTSWKIIGSKIVYNADTIVFVHPNPATQDVNDPELYKVANAADILVSNLLYDANAYYHENTLNASVLTLKHNVENYGAFPATEGFSVFDSIFEMLDEKTGEKIYGISFYANGALVELPVKTDLDIVGKAGTPDEDLDETIKMSQLKKGDLIYTNSDVDGYVANVRLFYRPSSKVEVNLQTTRPYIYKTFWSDRALRHGYVYDRFEDGLLVYFLGDDENINTFSASDLANKTEADCEVVRVSDCSIYNYIFDDLNSNGVADDGEDVTIEVSGFANLKSYKDAGLDCSRFYAHMYYGTIRAALVFE